MYAVNRVSAWLIFTVESLRTKTKTETRTKTKTKTKAKELLINYGQAPPDGPTDEPVAVVVLP